MASSSSSSSSTSLQIIPSNILYPIAYSPSARATRDTFDSGIAVETHDTSHSSIDDDEDDDLALIKRKLVKTESRLNETMREVSDAAI